MKKEKVLLTLPKINRLGGATVLTNELANYFLDANYDTIIYTSLIEPPASEFFQRKSLKIFTCTDTFPYNLKDFSYIFVNSQIFPIKLINSFSKKQPRYPKIFFLHKSPLDYIPDEQPWIYEFEEKIADASLFISEKTLEKNKPYFSTNHQQKFLYFRNPAPSIPAKLQNYHCSKKLTKILIVSNHTPPELKEASVILKKHNITIDGLGDGNLTGLIDYNLIAKYDLIITIGKTVQYCLALGQPVYIYDHFGGCGYLHEKNFNTAKKYNFSGRENDTKKTPPEIAKEIITLYNSASSFITNHHQSFLKEFLIDNVIPPILATDPVHKPVFTQPFIHSVQSAQILANNYFGVAAERDRLQDTLTCLTKENNELKTHLSNTLNSSSWKLGQKIINPLSKIKNLLN